MTLELEARDGQAAGEPISLGRVGRVRVMGVVVIVVSAMAGAAAATRDAGSGLPTSTASSTIVQPQPPAGSCHARGTGRWALPDAHCTPGAVDPAVRPSDLASTICADGYTERVRPSESVTEREKRASMRSYGDTGSLHGYEYDHLVPLELGGARNDSRNLWPEPGGAPNTKDRLEGRLRELVCSGRLGLATAQRAIARDWVAAYRRYAAA